MGDAIADVGDVRAVVVALAAALRHRGASVDAARLEDAAQPGPSRAEELLVMREALVVTRATWEPLPEGVPARHALAAAKRIAIDI